MSTPTLDQVALTVVDNYLTSCCRDMGVTMMTTAYSPIFNESLDFSCVIFDPSGAGSGAAMTARMGARAFSVFARTRWRFPSPAGGRRDFPPLPLGECSETSLLQRGFVPLLWQWSVPGRPARSQASAR